MLEFLGGEDHQAIDLPYPGNRANQNRLDIVKDLRKAGSGDGGRERASTVEELSTTDAQEAAENKHTHTQTCNEAKLKGRLSHISQKAVAPRLMCLAGVQHAVWARTKLKA